MSRIEDMIKTLCPEGVERVPLWKYTAWDKKFNAVDRSMQKTIIKYKYLLAKDLEQIIDNTGDIRILFTTEDVAYTTEEKAEDYISEGEVVAIPWGGNPTVKYYNGRFVSGDNRIATSIDTDKLNNKYLYYTLLDKLDIISKFYRGAGIKHPSMFSVLTFEIPLPPLSVQQEIVSVLDSFTTLIDKMKKEVELRKKQMECYREKVLSFKEGECEWKTLGCIGEVRMCKRILKNQTEFKGDIPFYKIGTFGKKPDAYISKSLYLEYKRKFSYPNVGDILISAAGTIGKCIEFDGTPSYYQDSNIVWIENDEKIVLNKYLKEFYPIAKWRIDDGGIVKRLYNENLKSTPIPVPPLSTQHEIVRTLDAFDSYITKLERLIALREKQYECYREKLLTFE